MKKGMIALVVVLLSLSLAGCFNPPTPPGGDIPKVVLDYDINQDSPNQTIVYVHGVDDVRYNNITLKIDNQTIVHKEHTFCLEHNFSKKQFNLTLDVWLDLEHYNFNASFKVYPKQNVVYQITYYDEEVKNIESNDLPYSEALNLIEEEEDA